MKTTDDIERELHERFAQQVYPAMGTQHYLAALAHVIIRYTAEQLASPCVYESRPCPVERPLVSTNQADTYGSWCQTHGWHCPARAGQHALCSAG